MKPSEPRPTALHPKPATVQLDSRAEDLASAMAPIIFSDCVAAYGRSGATTWLTLTACRHLLRGDQAVVDAPAVAFLRLTPGAAQQLRQALEVLDLKAADTTGAAH
jgi:hypothetical protein